MPPADSAKTPKRPRKVEKSETDESKEKQLSEYREKLTSIIQGVFFFEGQLKTVIGEKFGFTKQLTALYAKIKKSHSGSWDDAFYDELRFRLNFLVKDQDHEEGRRRVMTFLVLFALRLFSSGDDTVASFLLAYCEHTSRCVDIGVRQNTVSLIGLFFKYWRTLLFQDLSEEEEEQREKVSNMRDRLYDMVEGRLHDKEATVRAEVYKAMAPLQDLVIHTDFAKAIDRSPTEFIVAGLSDVSSNCRFVALQCMDMSQDDAVFLEAVADVATYDNSTRVRREALIQLSKVNPKKVAADQLTCLLHANLTSPDESLRQFTKQQLISVWLMTIAKKASARSSSSSEDVVKGQKGLGSALMILMARLDWNIYHEEMITVCLAGMEVIHRLLSADTSIGVTEMIKFLAEDQTQPRILTRSNKKELVDRGQSTANVAMKAFLWRCLVQYCHQQTDKKHSEKGQVDEAERDTCLTRLAPTLHDMCLLVESVFAFESTCPVDVTDEGAEAKNQEYKELALLDCLEICTFLEQEATGMEKWKNLLEKLLVDARLPKKITDHMGYVLVNVHYAEDPVAALGTVIEKFGDATHKEFDPNVTDLNLTVALPAADEGRPPSPDRTESPDFILHKIKVILSILRTGRFNQMNPYLQNIYNDLVPKCFRLDVMERKYALEVTGIIARLDAHMASGCSVLLWQALKLDDVAESRVSSMDAVCDLLIEFGFKQMKEWVTEKDGFTTLFENILKDNKAEERLYMKAFECSAKMFLTSKMRKKETDDDSWVFLMSAMLARIFHPSSRNAVLFKSCATQFLLIFSSTSREDQELLCSAISTLIADMIENIRDPFMSEVLIERACVTVTELTRASRLTRRRRSGEPEEISPENEAPVHRDFVERLIVNLKSVMDYKQVFKAHCSAIQAVDFTRFGSEFIANCIKVVDEAIDDSDADSEESPELGKLHKRLVILKKAAEKEEELQKKGDLQPKTAVRKPRGRPVKAFKCDDTILCTPKADSSTPAKEETMGTRMRLPRTAKQKNVNYDE